MIVSRGFKIVRKLFEDVLHQNGRCDDGIYKVLKENEAIEST